MKSHASQLLLKGRRSAIRLLAPGDEEEFLEQVRASRELHHPWVAPPSTSKAFRDRLERSSQPNQRAFVVCERSSGEIAGVVNINEIVMGAFRSGYLGYYGFSRYAGQGIMREGLGLVIRYAFRSMKLHRLEANIQPDNDRSIRIARSCGLNREGFSPKYLKINGRWRDHERWAIVR
jgi:ribosomal-protein-alanine N-acetyltransferase